MVAFVPLFAAVYTLFSDFLSEQLHKKGLPAETEHYMTNDILYAVPPDGETPADETEAEKIVPFMTDEPDEDYIPVPVRRSVMLHISAP